MFYHFRVCVLLYIASLYVVLSRLLSAFEDKLNLSCRFKPPTGRQSVGNFFRHCKICFKYLAAGEWSEACEMPGKPYGVYKMLENA